MKTSDEFPGSISLPFGIKTSHTWHEVGQILRIINDLDVNTFFELGTHVGGLASILISRKAYDADFAYFGMEINPDWIDKRVIDYVYVIDILSEHGKRFVETRMEGKNFIYCDNGNKQEEMRYYSSLLKSGDIIACHDYFDGQKVIGLENFGFDDSCGCRPEVWKASLDILFNNPTFEPLPPYLLAGTRIMGFVKK